jgi:hypothetical protein
MNNLTLTDGAAGSRLRPLALPHRNALDYKGLFIKAE